MSSNRYWTKSYFDVTVENRSLKIYKVDDPNNVIEIKQVADYLEVSGTNYIGVRKLSIFSDQIVFGTSRFRAVTMNRVNIGYCFN